MPRHVFVLGWRMPHRSTVSASRIAGSVARSRRCRCLKFSVHPPNQRFIFVDKLFNWIPIFTKLIRERRPPIEFISLKESLWRQWIGTKQKSRLNFWMRYRQRLPIISIHSSAIFIVLIALSSPQSGRRIESKTKRKLYNSCAWRKDLDGCGKTSRLQSNHDSTFSLFLIARKKNIFFLPLQRYKHTSYKFPSERSEEKRQWGNAKKTRKKEGNKIEKVCENQLSGDVRRAGESFRESVCKAAEMLRQRQKEKSKKSAGALKSFNKPILARAR